MNHIRQLIIGICIIFLLPIVATTAARPPSEFTPVEAQFKPVEVPPAVAGNFTVLVTPPPSIDPVVYESIATPPQPKAIKRTQPEAKAESVAKPKPKSKGGVGTPTSTGRSVSGLASWYCRPGVSICTNGYPASGAYAAAGPSLRAAFGGESWRGKTVNVCSGSKCIAVKLIDWCQCYKGESHEKVLDLYYSVFSRLPNNRVTVRW